jgi:hypothetical protein
MDEQMTNQSTEPTESTGSEQGFDDLFAEPSEPETPTESEAPAPFMTVKYNGAEQGLSQDEAITYAQKGMNYDKVYGQLEQMRNDPVRRAFEEQAARAGLSLNEYAERLDQFQRESAINRLANDFMNENPDATEDIARKFAEAQYQNNLVQKQQEQAEYLAQEQANQQQWAYQQIEAFQKAYPDVDIRSLPQDVVDEINAGESLLSAYRAHENKEMKNTITALRQNRYNEATSTGSLSNNSKQEGGGDPFLEGLLG